jgi:phenylacetate-CoA ligase
MNASIYMAIASKIPYSIKYGIRYYSVVRLINNIDRLPNDGKRQYVYNKVRYLAERVYYEIPFYKDVYTSNKFTPEQIRNFDDIKRIPVVTKKMMRQYCLENRSRKHRRKCRRANTGGTTGQSLDFFMPGPADTFEYAHIHKIWKQAGYRPQDMKLSFRGANIGFDKWIYSLGQNEIIINTYRSVGDQCQDLQTALKQANRIKYIHGYPSLVAQFCEQLHEYPSLRSVLSANVKGVFLGSEYPAPHYRNKIEKIFSVPIISWYGHGERAVLAYEKSESYLYEPFLSYGYTEAIPDEQGCVKLVSTGFANTVTPFVRYDTGDLIEPVDRRGGLLQSFRIKEGREAEVIMDRCGNPISLTAFIFGRHHAIFNCVDHVQLEERSPGKILVWVTAATEKDWKKYFDSSGVDLEFDFKTVDQPVRTATGKTPLLIRRSVDGGPEV